MYLEVSDCYSSFEVISPGLVQILELDKFSKIRSSLQYRYSAEKKLQKINKSNIKNNKGEKGE